MISEEITNSLVSLLVKVSSKNDIFISVESLYYFKENQKGRKRCDRHIHLKIPTKTFEGVQSQKRGKTPACVRSRMNEVSQVERYLFSKVCFLVRDDNM